MTVQACGDEHNLALWLTPAAIRDAFEDASEGEDPTADMTDEQLEEVGYEVLDGIHSTYRVLLDAAIADVKGDEDARDHAETLPGTDAAEDISHKFAEFEDERGYLWEPPENGDCILSEADILAGRDDDCDLHDHEPGRIRVRDVDGNSVAWYDPGDEGYDEAIARVRKAAS